MADQNNASANAGSAGSVPAGSTAAGQASTVDWEKQYKEAESKIGSLGNEVGEYRKFLTDIAPLLTKLEASPELVQAIVDGKIDGNYAKAALEGKLSVAEAATATAAQAEVEKALEGKQVSPEKISELVEQAVSERMKQVEEKDEMRDFEKKTSSFIDSTPDFKDYASDIDTWLEDHPDVLDVSVAYFAVKGEMSVKAAQKASETAAAEAAKNVVLNAGPGGGKATYIQDGGSLADKLIAGRSSANVF